MSCSVSTGCPASSSGDRSLRTRNGGGRPDGARLRQLNSMSRAPGNLMVNAPEAATFPAPSVLVYSPEADNGCEDLVKLNAYFSGPAGVVNSFRFIPKHSIDVPPMSPILIWVLSPRRSRYLLVGSARYCPYWVCLVSDRKRRLHAIARDRISANSLRPRRLASNGSESIAG